MSRIAAWAVAAALVIGLAASGVTLAGASTEADQALAAVGTLAPGDFPADGGWQGETLGPTTQETKDRQIADLGAYPECAALSAAYRDLYGAPSSTGLYQTDIASVAGTVVVFPSAKVAKQYVAAYRAPKTADCFLAYWASLYDASNAAKISLQKLPSAVTKAAGGSAGVRLKSEYQLNGVPTVTYFDFLAVQHARGVGSFTFANNDAPFPFKLQQKVLVAVAGRLGK